MPSVTTLEIVLAALLVGSVSLVVVQWLQLRRARRRILRLESARSARRASRPPRPPRALQTATRAVRVMAETAAHVREHGVSSLVASSIEDLTHWASESQTEIAKVTAPDGTVTIFFSDIEGSTELNERLGDRAWVKVLAQHDSVVRSAIARHRGQVVKTQGDGFMVVFRHPADAVHAGLEIQDRLSEQRGRLRQTRIAVRIGLHRGVVVARDGDFFGRNVAMAARVAAEAQGGEILVSDELREALIDSSEFVFAEPVEATLKGLTGTHTLWLVDGIEPEPELDDEVVDGLPWWRRLAG